jgi:CheY-like chemotaxis protein
VAKKILLADDSLTIQKVVELTFSDSEYDLICVSNGQRALDKVVEHAPDLILADAVMPEKNGYEVCEAIKSNPTTSRIPVILLSGTFEPFDRDRAERLGCDAIVSKPFDSQQLLRQVEALLSRPAADAPSTATVAIPTMTSPAPPGPSASRAPAETGFSSEDFTGAIRTPAAIAGGADLFEEEYGHGDVETAIAAFEKAHPEFAHVGEGDASSAMTPEPGPRQRRRPSLARRRDDGRVGDERLRATSPPAATAWQSGCARRAPPPSRSRRRLRRPRPSGCLASPSRTSSRSRSRRTTPPRGVPPRSRCARTRPRRSRSRSPPTTRRSGAPRSEGDDDDDTGRRAAEPLPFRSLEPPPPEERTAEIPDRRDARAVRRAIRRTGERAGC